MTGLLVGLLGAVVLGAVFLDAERRQAQGDMRRWQDRADGLADIATAISLVAAEDHAALRREKIHSRALGKRLGEINRRAVAHERTIDFLLGKMIERELAQTPIRFVASAYATDIVTAEQIAAEIDWSRVRAEIAAP